MTISEHNRSGFTMVELLFSMLIIGGLLAGVYATIRFVRGRASDSQTKTNLQLIKAAIGFFYNDKNEYPKKITDLVPRYIDKEKALKDGWDNEFKYRPTPGGKHPYELFSYGSEGLEGSAEGRISAWDM